ncbi:hypothetical protein [Parapedobacter koreensis]|uniref:Glycosyl hydrolase family 67 N-terminus n=1 Tax=Parapedobacter koreensis TaxID=332977 RepID=A0A1H7UK48_9SPHI|nr:hypothetical protein [Parapedobacter koreensis]SEL97393.1 hypothetical protein SAMN05421740_11710 [Parapedobacter koreensis]
MRKKKCLRKVGQLFVFLMLVSQFGCDALTNKPQISIVTDTGPGEPVNHGLAEITNELRAKRISFETVGSIEEAQGKHIVVVGLSEGNGAAAQLLVAENRAVPAEPESLAIWSTRFDGRPGWVIAGSDNRGLMYGLLDVAERISWATDSQEPLTAIVEVTEKPDAAERAISIYTMNRAYWESRFYDEAYWDRYLNTLAKNRFNSLVLIFGYENGGFLAPVYPYFFDVDGFPDVHMVGIDSGQQKRNLAMLNRLVEMAHERGIRFSVGIWDHIYRGGVQGGGVPEYKEAPNQPQEHLVWGVTADNLTAYTKAGMEKFIKVVPGLDGIQLRVHWESGLTAAEQLVFFPEIFRMVKKTAPNLRLDIRAKELPDQIIDDALEIGVNFRLTTKFWMEQMGMPYHPTKTNPEESPIRHSYAYLLRYPQKYKMHWRLWNGGTSRMLLWGSPAYVKRFVEATHLYDGEGFEVNEPLATKMEAQPHDAQPFELIKPDYQYYDYEFERYWHFFQTFGRMGYNPDTSPEVWEKAFQKRFGNEVGPIIEQALHKASWVLPRIVTSVFPYREFPMTRGWPEKERLGDLPAYSTAEFSDMQQFANFTDEANLLVDGGEEPRILPSENSRWFEQVSQDINRLVSEAEKYMPNERNRELEVTIADLKILSNLALFHSRRIPAAVSYCLFEKTKDVTALDDAIAFEREAITAWSQIVAASKDVFNDDLLFGVCNAGLCGHWKDELEALERGLRELEQKRDEMPTTGAAIRTAPRYQTASDKGQLFNVVHDPVVTNPVGEPLKITVTIKAPAGVKWVRLRHRSVNQEKPYKTLPMLRSGSADTYSAVVAAGEIDPTWDYMYFIEMMDDAGNGRIYPDLNEETPYIIVKLIR